MEDLQEIIRIIKILLIFANISPYSKSIISWSGLFWFGVY